jgi:BirA family transcriptional regulator, biotin operon repressor / biotin---[acetyl-CoA-carboxylase] ligase
MDWQDFPLTQALPVQLTVYSEVGSTNAYLAAYPGDLSTFRVVVTDNQTAGRGRQGRTWSSPAGSGLAVSIGLPAASLGGQGTGGASPQWLPLLPLLVGSVLAGAIEEEVSDPVTVKWPNDVLVGVKKVAGILVEQVPGVGVVVGFGVNLRYPEEALPTPHSTSLHLHGASGPGLADRIISSVVGALIELWEAGNDLPEGSWEAVLARLDTIGRAVRVDFPDGSVVVGRAVGVRQDGALRLEPGDGSPEVTVVAGDVWHLRVVGESAEGEKPGSLG